MISSEIDNGVAFVTLDRPAALNALSLEMLQELRAELERCVADPAVHAVFLQGAGDKAFCAGGDIRAIYDSLQGSGDVHHQFFVAEYSLDHWLHFYPKPYVVLMDGITMGGGMGLAQGSKLRIVGERTRLAMPEVGIGLFPDVGGSYFLSRLAGGLGAYLALTGIQIRGADALYAQLADVYLTASGIVALRAHLSALEWTDDHRTDIRDAVYQHAATGLPAPSLSVLRPAIDLHFSQTTVASILASLDAENRPEYSEWAKLTAILMRSRSPTMLRVARRQLVEGKTLSLAACFRMELGMVEQCFVQGDLREGVRALIIDKNNAPRWSPDRLEDVSDESVAAFFKERWRESAHPLATLEQAEH